MRGMGVAAGQIPQLARDVGRGPLSSPFAPEAEGDPGIDLSQIPKDWFLKTLAPECRPIETVLSATYTNVLNDNVQIGTYEVDEGVTTILFRYSFFVLVNDIGGRVVFARPCDSVNRIALLLTLGGASLVHGSVLSGSTPLHAFGGRQWLDDEPNRTIENLPLFLKGRGTLEARYVVVNTNPVVFTDSTIGLSLWGLEIPTQVFYKKLVDAGIWG